MNSRHKKTLAAIFVEPTLASVPFADIEALLLALGAEIDEGAGSRVAITLRDQRIHFHRPHPGKEARKYQVEGVRELLQRLEIKP